MDSYEVTERINHRIDELWLKDGASNDKPYVCICCDEFVRPSQLKTLSVNRFLNHAAALDKQAFGFEHGDRLRNEYTHQGDLGRHDIPETRKRIEQLPLSPRGLCGIVLRSNRRSHRPGG